MRNDTVYFRYLHRNGLDPPQIAVLFSMWQSLKFLCQLAEIWHVTCMSLAFVVLIW